ncbi:beta-ketoacyl synthase N-terminal-like domain-containing protein [Ulvibacterium sp.]|uniref:beta-ketoacyl synthase N-terminal-like domain-containing protein n=1 Tax=Ulvibacterium sp. TaxID=2665914 RepID=UPI0026295F01|nr:beta-ketoacyl synthase N-terminal-like domain-containing protein [Ulvibacterium sp.]
MKPVYINSVASISAQSTFDNSVFLEDIAEHTDNVIRAMNPNYKEFIPPAAARRMAKGIKMGVATSKIALKEANLENVDAIITGTGLGCIADSEKFVSKIINDNEEYLTPTSFIQSTHNTVAGQIALGIGCKGYNFTYVHSSISFESALLDAKLQLENDEAQNILVGGVDELADHHIKIHKLVNHIKKDVVNSRDLLESGTKGAVFGEGASFFVLSNEKSETTYAQVLDVTAYNSLPAEELQNGLKSFLHENSLEIEDIDIVVLGNNGDIDYDTYYNLLSQGSLKNTAQVYYKHLCGEFNTASSFGIWMATKMIRTQRIPEAVRLNGIQPSKIGTVLLYNQYRGENHSLVLLRGC